MTGFPYIDAMMRQLEESLSAAVNDTLQAAPSASSAKTLRAIAAHLKWGDEEIKALAVVLPLCGQLTELRLAVNEIGPEGARAIGEWLRDNRSLKVLDLTGNKIGAEGAKALADALRVNDLSPNFMSVSTGWMTRARRCCATRSRTRAASSWACSACGTRREV